MFLTKYILIFLSLLVALVREVCSERLLKKWKSWLGVLVVAGLVCAFLLTILDDRLTGWEKKVSESEVEVAEQQRDLVLRRLGSIHREVERHSEIFVSKAVTVGKFPRPSIVLSVTNSGDEPTTNLTIWSTSPFYAPIEKFRHPIKRLASNQTIAVNIPVRLPRESAYRKTETKSVLEGHEPFTIEVWGELDGRRIEMCKLGMLYVHGVPRILWLDPPVIPQM